MKNYCFKRIIAVIVALAVILSVATLGITAEITTDSASVEISEDGVVLNLYFHRTYYAWPGADEYGPGSPSNYYIKGRAFALTNEAIMKYNDANPDNNITLSDITSIKVSTAEYAFLTFSFVKFIEEKLPQIKVLDMKNSNFTSHNTSTTQPGDNTMPNRYFSGGVSAAPLYLTMIEKIILPDTLKTANFGVFARLSTLKTVELGKSLTTLGNSLFLECTSLENVSFHGSAEEADDASVFFTQLISQIASVSTIKKVDLSGSAVASKELLGLSDNLEYLDLRNCLNLEYSSEDGAALYDKLTKLKESGATVYMPSKEELASKFVVSGKTNDKSMGIVSGTAVYDKKDTPIEHTFIATPINEYELVGWQVNGAEELLDAGEPDADGKYRLKLSVSDATNVIGIFEIKAGTVPAGNEISEDENGKLRLSLSGITNDNEISPYIQRLLKNLKVKTGKQYYPEDIDSIKISTTSNANLKSSFVALFTDGYYQALKKNLKKLDLSDAVFYLGRIPNEYAKDFINLSEIILPDDTKELQYRCFMGCTALANIKLPDTVWHIGWECFLSSGLEKIDLPDSVTRIERAAFHSCTNLNGIIKIPNNIKEFASQWGKTEVLKTANLYNDWGTQWMFINTEIKGLEFHGVGNESALSCMIASFNWKTAHYDFKDSGITEKQLALIPFTSATASETPYTTYLDIRGCPIDYTTARGKALKKKLERYIKENPDVTILWDEGIVRDKSYTKLEAVIELNENQSMEQALSNWSTENNGADATAITSLTVKTNGNRKLNAADCEIIRKNMLASLRILDFSETAFEGNAIPDDAFANAENLLTLKLPEELEKIGKNAFYCTSIESINLPKNVKFIDDKAFAECFNMEGECILPNGLEYIGTGVFYDSGFTKLEYHGPVDIAIASNFAFAIETAEYVDLRGCSNITEKNFPTTWSSVKVVNIDYCSVEYVYGLMNYWNLQAMKLRTNCVLTVHNQFVAYDNLEEMLAENIYGKSQEAYPMDNNASSNSISNDLGLWDAEEGINYITVTSDDSDDLDENYSDDNYYFGDDDSVYEEELEGEKTTTKKKKVVKVLRKKKPIQTESNDYTWVIYVSIAAVAVLAAIATIIIIPVKRKKKINAVREGEE